MWKTREHPSKETLNELFEYRDGKLYRKKRTSNRIMIGSCAGTNMNNGYRLVSVESVLYLEHRCIWILHFGSIPDEFDIDHKDCNRSNNKIENLRLATPSQNMTNRRGAGKRNSSGFKGVSLRESGKWKAQIWYKEKPIYLGLYSTPEQAHEAYQAAAKELHGEFARLE